VEVGGRTVSLGPGGYAFAPRGVAHAFTQIGAGPARLLLLASPGGIHEQFVAEVGAPLGDPAARPEPADAAAMERVVAAAEKYGIEFLQQPARRPARRDDRGAAPDAGPARA
jgi:hypothetical protein